MLYSGGPVQTNQVMMLYRINDTPENSHQVFDGVCLGGDLEIMERILMEEPGKESFRAYLGYSGWGPGQLETEMQSGSWITLPADPSIVFDKRSTRIWPSSWASKSSDIAVRPRGTFPAAPNLHYADMPFVSVQQLEYGWRTERIAVTPVDMVRDGIRNVRSFRAVRHQR